MTGVVLDVGDGANHILPVNNGVPTEMFYSSSVVFTYPASNYINLFPSFSHISNYVGDGICLFSFGQCLSLIFFPFMPSFQIMQSIILAFVQSVPLFDR